MKSAPHLLLRFRAGTGRLSRREGGGKTGWLEAINRPVLIALLGSAAFLSVKWPRPGIRRYAALRYFNIGAASIYVVKFRAEPLLGGKPQVNVARSLGTYCLKAAARSAPLAVAAGFAVATPLPTPPCGTPPVPAYASLAVQPAMAILGAEELDANVWQPSSCTGWPAASRSRVVVAVAGLVRVAGGPETLLARAGAVSTLRTMRYWSTTDKQWRPLFLDAAALAGPAEGGERRGDFRPSELQAGRTFYFWVHDSRSGPLVYRMRVLEHSPQRMALSEENVSPVRAFGLTLFQPAALQTVVFAQRQTNDVWGLYILVRIDRQASSFIASGHEASTANRALALFRYLAGVPTDAEPPAVR